MLEPNNPLKIIIPGAPAFLKNDRLLIVSKGTPRLLPSTKVKKFIGNAQAAIQRQLPGDFQIIEGGIGIVAEIHLDYKSVFPRSDVDNAYSTLQESFMGTLIEDDKQVEGFFVFRKRAKSKLGQHALLYIWESKSITEELLSFLEWRQYDN